MARELKEICADLLRVKDTKSELNRQVESTKQVYRALDTELQEALVGAGLERVTFKGHHFGTKSACIASVADREALMAWCEQNQIDPMYFFMPSVKKIRSFVGEAQEKGEEVPAGLSDVLPINVISIVKAGSKK